MVSAPEVRATAIQRRPAASKARRHRGRQKRCVLPPVARGVKPLPHQRQVPKVEFSAIAIRPRDISISNLGIAPGGAIPSQCHPADFADRFEPHLADVNFGTRRIFIVVAVNDNTEVRLVHPVCRAGDVVEGRNRPRSAVLALQF